MILDIIMHSVYRVTSSSEGSLLKPFFEPPFHTILHLIKALKYIVKSLWRLKWIETKIILISAFNIDGVLVKELENGSYISKYILKPIETDSLVNLIDEIVKE